MPTVVYQDMPSLEQWRRDTGGNASKRDDDILLARIDELVKTFHRQPDAFERIYVVADLYFTTNYWLKLAGEGNRVIKKSLEPAVFALFKVAVDSLCKSYSVTVNILPNILEFVFGREMGAHGQSMDRDEGYAQYLTRAEARKYRIFFGKNGLAFQSPWWNKHWNASWSLVLAESSRARPNPPTMFDQLGSDYGGFTMGMNRELYMAPHLCTLESEQKKMNFYHSSYLAGSAVLCTGTMLIRGGRILGIRNHSGHYRPTLDHLVNVLEALRMFGVALDVIYVEALVPKGGGGTEWCWASGDKLLRDRGNYARMERISAGYSQHKPDRPVGVQPRWGMFPALRNRQVASG